MAHSVPTLLLTGTIGVGKTAIMGEVVDQLRAAGIPHASLDLDALSQNEPAPSDDPFNSRLTFQNLAAVWSNLRLAGATRLVVAHVVESRDELALYRQAIPGTDITVVRLVGAPQILRHRIARREVGSSREWHLARSTELTAIMDVADIGDLVVNTDGRRRHSIAREILRRIGWISP